MLDPASLIQIIFITITATEEMDDLIMSTKYFSVMHVSQSMWAVGQKAVSVRC
jgi:hypothetical protein